LAFWGALVALTYMAVARPMPGGPEGALSVNDKLVHAVVYAALTVLGLMGRLKTGAVLFVLLMHGALIESLQALVPDRTADWKDLMANAAGCVAASIAWRTAGRDRA
jgi:VanZ family protein